MTDDEKLPEGFEVGDPPRLFWDDFGFEDWEWVARAVLQERFGQTLEDLWNVFHGKVAVDLKNYSDEEKVKFALDDPTIQELIWGPFFESLELVASFERKVREYHHSKYGNREAPK